MGKGKTLDQLLTLATLGYNRKTISRQQYFYESPVHDFRARRSHCSTMMVCNLPAQIRFAAQSDGVEKSGIAFLSPYSGGVGMFLRQSAPPDGAGFVSTIGI